MAQAPRDHINALMTDMYQVTMAYGYFKSGRHNEPAVFDLYFRKCPFEGHYAVAGGIESAIQFVQDYKFTPEQIEFLRHTIPTTDESFFQWLANLDTSEVTIVGIPEGGVVFPREPILRVSGPIAICQLLETTLLTLINFATLLTTNARRLRIAAGKSVRLLEFGLRRAQGPDGGLTASRNAVIGGFDATSNLLASHLFGLRASGTTAHAFVCSFDHISDITNKMLVRKGGSEPEDFVAHVLSVRKRLGGIHLTTHEGELAAFVSYAITFPSAYVALVDTYNTLHSGIPNALTVIVSLIEFGYPCGGLRLDSGDLCELSKQGREMFKTAAQTTGIAELANITIIASDDITEERILGFVDGGHQINVLGIGTHLVTCKKQPALGGVYKLVEVSHRASIKLAESHAKLSLPGPKIVFRLFDEAGVAVADVIALEGETAPQGPQAMLYSPDLSQPNPISVSFAQATTPTQILFQGHKTSAATANTQPAQPVLRDEAALVQSAKERCEQQIASLPPQTTQPRNATEFPVYLSSALRQLLHNTHQTTLNRLAGEV